MYNIHQDLYNELWEIARSESERTGWMITTDDIIRRGLKLMRENNVIEVEK